MCIVTTAKPLDDATAKELKNILKLFVKQEQVIELTTKVNPEIIGGMGISIGGDNYVDMTVGTKVRMYTEADS